MGFEVASRMRGLSDTPSREAIGTDRQCRSGLFWQRWADGLVCPSCGHRVLVVDFGREACVRVAEAKPCAGLPRGRGVPDAAGHCDVAGRSHPVSTNGRG